MDKGKITELNRFMGRAAKATYAAGGGKVEPWRKGFIELEFKEGDWYYRDSYSGYLRSWGQEVIWYQDKPIWTCLYGGGMADENMDAKFASETFGFLKKAFLSGEKVNSFQPRGPVDFSEGDWKYHCNVKGDISKFSGDEFITHNDKIVFTHEFVGGLVIGEDNLQ